MITIDQFVTNWEHQRANPDADPYGAQCVELVNEWCKEIGIEEFSGNAIDFVNDPHPHCDWIPNSPVNFPDPGDIVVWGNLIDPYGHTAVCIGPADANSFQSLDQNWYNSNLTMGSPAEKVTHGYRGVLGWYHPRIISGGIPVAKTVPFWVYITPGAHWFEHPDGADRGVININPTSPIKIVAVLNDGVSDWYQADLGAWYVVNTSTTPAPDPNPPVPQPPTPDVNSIAAQLRQIAHQIDGK
jgi:hypothetical protein